MKSKLLFLLFTLPFLGISQTPISTYESPNGSTYSILSTSPILDQSATGANVTWTFDMLSQTGVSSDSYAAPSAAELITFPGTTSVATVTRGTDVTKIFVKNTANTLSITGAEAEGLLLNYSTDNALIGTLPLNFGYANTDNVAGTFVYNTTTNGTFSGTLTTSVDAYGTLVMNDLGAGAFNAPVTRLKVLQNLNLSVSIITGNATQTSYNYYDTNGNLVLRTTTASITVPLLSISTTTSIYERLLTGALSTFENELSENKFRISPNPIIDDLNLTFDTAVSIKSILISDISGRQILKVDTSEKTLKVNQLNAGIYIVTISTDKGVMSQKIIKQ
ncbi:T9SS type A sorting domain-containing protein [Mariniflexile sp.]|uniref:T9SS type A sorting domain-containing protein n=1 Tax=Mariniflexile sp. TaxID=1979402 RepID=UPI004048BB09